MRNERARDTGNRTYLARRCRPVLLAQLYYAGRELLFCCGVLTAFLCPEGLGHTTLYPGNNVTETL